MTSPATANPFFSKQVPRVEKSAYVNLRCVSCARMMEKHFEVGEVYEWVPDVCLCRDCLDFRPVLELQVAKEFQS